MVNYAYLIIVFPLIGFLINGLFGYKLKKGKISGFIGSLSIFLSFLVSIIIFFDLISLPAENRKIVVTLFNWINSGIININISYLIDPLSIVMTLIVTGVGLLIHIYSIGYMHGDKGFARFFAFLNLFIFAMLNLILSDNFLLLFLGWEGVGLCSYLLIGFWYEKKFTGDAANKAFWVNRIGDLAFIIALFFIFVNFKSLNFQNVFDNVLASPVNTSLITVITILLFIGATGKSAQIPLFVWLPDAMAGPTPVSALIHAATMVTAGVYMVARCSVMFAISPITLTIIAYTGAFTALLAATIAVAQNDIKKILAYSTISQLGLMFLALGSGGFSTGIFHVTTHAFFKALMFLGAGSVIHSLHEEQDITKMGGLKDKMKITFLTFLMGGIAISGIPPFSGFFSKDEIFSKVYLSGNLFLYVVGILVAFFTAFYIFRLIYLTFYGKARYDTQHVTPHESPKTMTYPLIILAVLSVIGGFIGLPHIIGFNMIEHFLEPVFSNALKFLPEHNHLSVSTEIVLISISVIAAIVSILLSKKNFFSGEKTEIAKGTLFNFIKNKYKIDELYGFIIVNPLKSLSKFLYSIFDFKIIDGIVNGTGRFFIGMSSDLRKLQTGVLQDYAVISIGGIIALLLYIIFTFSL
jgi:NADH-quinone oxidoreductase subunit L